MIMKTLHACSFICAIIGALNIGAIGIGHFLGFDGDILGLMLSSWPRIEWGAYVLIGASALWLLVEASSVVRPH